MNSRHIRDAVTLIRNAMYIIAEVHGFPPVWNPAEIAPETGKPNRACQMLQEAVNKLAIEHALEVRAGLD